MSARSRFPRPMSMAQVRKIKPIEAMRKPPAPSPTRVASTFLSFDKGARPEASTRLEHVRDAQGKGIWRLDVETPGSLVPPDFARPPIERRTLDPKIIKSLRGPLETAPERSKVLGLNPIPKRLRLPPRPILRRRDGRKVDPLYVFPPDGRWVYHDHNYPWCCFGRVVCGSHIGSGVLIGPRHVLTASHVLDWNAPWAEFYANYNGGHHHGVAHTWCVWYYEKISDNSVGSIDRDYVVLVLDQYFGTADKFGCMGAKTYVDDYDDEDYWSSLGYEEDFAAATLPTFQLGISLEEIDGGNAKAMSTRDGDFMHAHSGGPVFGWWDGGPYVIGVACAGAEDNDGLMNIVSGGVAMVRLIKSAREQTP